MADNNYVSFFETPEYLDSLETETEYETEEEKRRRLERERLEQLQASSKTTTPTEKKEYVSFFETDEYKNSYKDKEPVETSTELDDDISLARKIDYGMAQEPTAIGSAYRIIKSGVQAAVDKDETYDEARKRIEEERQEKIFEEFPEFEGKKEDAGVLLGRGTMALVDPVTFIIPWTKIAKAGKIASIASGAGVAGADLALREEALYGEINPKTVALGMGLGAAGATVGEVVTAFYRKGINETVEVLDEAGKTVTKKVQIPAETRVPPIGKELIKDVDEAAENTLINTKEIVDNFGVKARRLEEIKLLKKEIKAERSKFRKQKTTIEDVESYKIDKLSKVSPEVKYKKQLDKLDKEEKDLMVESYVLRTETIPKDLVDVTGEAMLEGFKKNVLNEGMARALVQEMTKPLFGGIIGAGVGASFTEEGDTNATMITLGSLGFMAGAFQRKIQTTPFEVIPKVVKNAANDEFEIQYRKNIWLHLKSITAGSHVQDLMAYSAPVVNYAAKMFKMQGGGVKLGRAIEGLSVEEEALKQTARWRNELIDMVSEHDTNVMELAGKIVNERGLKKSVKNRFIKPQDKLDEKLYAEAEILALKIEDYTSRFKQYAIDAGLDFEDEVSYGLTQILNDKAIDGSNFVNVRNKLAEAFIIQSKNDPTLKLLSKKEAKNIADQYLDSSSTARYNSIWAKEDSEFLFQGNAVGGLSEDSDFVLNAARHFSKKRTLYDQEARAYVSDLFEQNPLITLRQLNDNTINVAEFSRTFGAKGQGIKDLFSDIDKYMKNLADPENKYKTVKDLYTDNLGIKARADREKQKIKDSLEAYFRVYGAESLPKTQAGQSAVTLLQSGLAIARLGKVALPSTGDWIQTITNSGYKAAWKAAKSDIKLSQELALRGGTKQIDGKDATFLDKFLGNNRFDNVIERELADVFLMGRGPAVKVQRKAIEVTRQFFEAVQLGRVTRVAREFAFDAGTHRGMDIAGTIGKGKKVSNALQKEIDATGLAVKDFEYLSKFKTIDEAYKDKIGKIHLTKIGIKAADRDALIPGVGNRRLFSQSKNPYVKFLGSFLSWAQAKTSQTNAIVSRVEQGDAALALRMIGALPIYYAIMDAQVTLSSSEEYKKARAEDTTWQTIGETIGISGLNTVWVDKAKSIVKFQGYGVSVAEQLAPVLGFMDDILRGFIISPTATAIQEGPVEAGKEVLEELKRQTPVVKTVVPLAEQMLKPEDRVLKSTGGIVRQQYFQGKKVSEDYPVSNAKKNPSDRINDITKEPYSLQMEELGLDVFQEK